MLAALLNLGFAGGGTAVVVATDGGYSVIESLVARSVAEYAGVDSVFATVDTGISSRTGPLARTVITAAGPRTRIAPT